MIFIHDYASGHWLPSYRSHRGAQQTFCTPSRICARNHVRASVATGQALHFFCISTVPNEFLQFLHFLHDIPDVPVAVYQCLYPEVESLA
jgi:hypothetical protein